jgi:hypothetical protein
MLAWQRCWPAGGDVCRLLGGDVAVDVGLATLAWRRWPGEVGLLAMTLFAWRRWRPGDACLLAMLFGWRCWPGGEICLAALAWAAMSFIA